MEPTPDEALLTAYLDGELTPEERQHLEQRFADEPELRQRLTVLEETWHYLDLLEHDSADVEKIETTMRVAAVSVAGSSLASAKTSRLGKWSIALLAGLTLFAVTFYFGRQDPMNDYSFRLMMERLDTYLAVADGDDFALVQQLTDNRVFLPPPLEDEPLIDQASSRAENAELYQLCYQNSQRFFKLPWGKRRAIWNLHRSIEMEVRHTELALTLQNYAYWHKSLQPYERSELQKSKSLDEKIANIIKLKDRLDKLLPYDAPAMPSELVGIEETPHLAGTLARLPHWQKERLLNNAPLLIIHELKQLSY